MNAFTRSTPTNSDKAFTALLTCSRFEDAMMTWTQGLSRTCLATLNQIPEVPPMITTVWLASGLCLNFHFSSSVDMI